MHSNYRMTLHQIVYTHYTLLKYIIWTYSDSFNESYYHMFDYFLTLWIFIFYAVITKYLNDIFKVFCFWGTFFTLSKYKVGTTAPTKSLTCLCAP